MNKYLRIIFLSCVLLPAMLAKAQSFITWSGNLPVSETLSSCSVPDPMSNEDAYAYLTTFITLHNPGDCEEVFTVVCSHDDPYWTDEFHVELIRRFHVTNPCGAFLDFQQTLWVDFTDETFNNTELPEAVIDHYDFEEYLPNNDNEQITTYLAGYGITPPSCWNGGFAASYHLNAIATGTCETFYQVTFTLERTGCSYQLIQITQIVRLHPTNPVEMTGDGTLTTLYMEACGEDPNGKPRVLNDIDSFEPYGAKFSKYINKDFFTISCNDTYTPSEDGCDGGKYARTYTINYSCTNQTFTLHQEILLRKELGVTGFLDDVEYEGEIPAPYTTIEQLRQAGISVCYTCDESELVISSEDVPMENFPAYTTRTYTITSNSCSTMEATFQQKFQQIVKNPEAFRLLSVDDVTVEGANDGRAELGKPTYLDYCPSCPGQTEKIFKVVWHNKDTNETWTTDPNNPECDIFVMDSLTAGNYEVKVFPICPDFSWSNTPVFKDEFKVVERKMEVSITNDLGLISNHTYFSYMAVVSVKGPNGEYVVYDEYDNLVRKFNDEWELTDGLLYSPNKQEWDLYEMYNPYMGGQGAYENILWRYQTYNEQYGHGLQRFIVAKDEHNSLTYRLYKKNRDGDLGQLFKEVTKTLYHEKLWCSNDPNEIFGPAGYTDADSVCVRMINTTDDVAYTIMFENDPEFATAAAARVKVECPLSDKIDPTTFRLGNFGFNNMTFEVPELASYYNQRLQLDSLGYWLDVTASIQVPGNIAYWIFQTIDPATGVAPIDSLGFLPVNDTLTGCGEGFVTFTASLANNGTRGLHTGDELLENAQIYFDENEVVPTNDYINHLDAVAPTSSIVCDTTGAFEAKRLNIGFSASDDMDGSGVRYVELYANIDQTGFELFANVHPDSVFVFPMDEGTMFEFMGLAVDNVGNKENYKPYPELYYSLGNPPTALSLSNDYFNENDAVGTLIGNFSTLDDQSSDIFTYSLVQGEGSSDNNLFRIEGNRLLTNHDFRCYGNYNYNIRVRTTDLTDCYLEKSFSIYAIETEEIEPVQKYQYICYGDEISFAGHSISEAGLYYDTLISQHGCDSIICLQVLMNPAPDTTNVVGTICYGYDYSENGFDLTAADIAALADGWTMEEDLVLNVDRYAENVFGCNDVTQLQLTVHPAFESVEDVVVCPTDLPFRWHNRPYVSDTTVSVRYATSFGCDSTYTLHLTLNPDYGTQSDDLSNWSWYSTYIDQSNGKGLKNLETALGRKGNLIKSKMSFVQYYPEQNIWYGNLGAIDNESMFMINTTAEVTAAITGCYALTCPITIRSGWNWIGYPCVHTNSVASAMSGLARTPQDGDVLKSKSAFATYYGAYDMWYGSLGVLNPGEGYMYMSNGDAENTLIYPSITRDQGVPVALQETFWQADGHQFARNITFVGAIELDGSIVESDTLEVGVFCHGEQRGSGRAIYLDKLGEYRIFLTAHGEEGDELNFRLYDHEKNKERRIRSRQQVVFHDDDSYGKIDNPYLFVFNTDYDKLIEAEICDGQYYVENGFRAYRSGTYFNELPNDSIIRLDLTVNPVYHEEKSVVAFEFPFHYDDMTFDAPGTYNLQYNTAEECDSTLVLTVQPYDGVRELLISPVPAERSQRVTLFFPFTADEQHDLLVEVYTLGGNLMQTHKPKRFPIELDPFAVSGTYMVKITMGTGEVLTGKIIVK